MAQLDQRHRGHVVRQVEQKAALAQQRFQLLPVRFARQRLQAKIGNPPGLRNVAPPIMGREDRDPVAVECDMPQNQRQHALADTAEADDDQASRDRGVNLWVHPTDPFCNATGPEAGVQRKPGTPPGGSAAPTRPRSRPRILVRTGAWMFPQIDLGGKPERPAASATRRSIRNAGYLRSVVSAVNWPP